MKVSFTEAEINSLIERFEARQLPKVEWTHEAHLIVAIWYVSKYSSEKALSIVRKNITAHNAAVGTPNTDDEGYHETITKFWLTVADSFIKSQETNSTCELCNRFIASGISKSSFPLLFYSEKALFSVKARRVWVEPDKKLFDF
ncbi:MAG: hypothetical protein KDC83_05095 [Flavobacteriales bacterium]|nr:hypothetical protein [Flavobacteriales bacterium]